MTENNGSYSTIILEGYLRIECGYEHGPTLEFSEKPRGRWTELHDLLDVYAYDDVGDPRKFKLTIEVVGDRRIIRNDTSQPSIKKEEEV